MVIRESAENYLECILQLKQKRGAVRSVDIVNEMGFKKSSVSVAMKQFREDGYIVMDGDGLINFTKKGLTVAERVLERHRTITRALTLLGISKKTAEEDACKIEHDLSAESFARIKEFVLRSDGESGAGDSAAPEPPAAGGTEKNGL